MIYLTSFGIARAYYIQGCRLRRTFESDHFFARFTYTILLTKIRWKLYICIFKKKIYNVHSKFQEENLIKLKLYVNFRSTEGDD